MPVRNTILENFKTLLEGITTANGYNRTVKKVYRKMVPYDVVPGYPTLMILGGSETYNDLMGTTTESDPFTIIIRGWTKNSEDPDDELGIVLSDVIKRLHTSSNSYLDRMRLVSLETDEGYLSLAEMEGLALFSLTIEVIYAFERSNP